MISLAVEHDVVELLDQLRAREIPSLYHACFVGCNSPDCDYYYDEDMVKHVAAASSLVLDYFTKPIKIKDRLKRENIFLFPYMSNLINFMIQGNSAYVEKMLKISIEHNRNTLKRLNELIKKTIDDRISYFNEWNKYQKYGKVYEDSIKDSVSKRDTK